jgi:hypothetical protein
MQQFVIREQISICQVIGPDVNSINLKWLWFVKAVGFRYETLGTNSRKVKFRA